MSNQKRIVVALCGRAQSGKDAFAAVFVENGFDNVKFATPLKDTVLTLFPHMTHEHVNGSLKDEFDAEIGGTPRSLMQFLGTDLLQHQLMTRFPKVGRGIFSTQTAARVRGSRKNVVITDVRFGHEKTALLALGGTTFVKILRGGAVDGVHSRHESETGTSDIECDVVIHNDGSLEDLRNKAADLLDKLQTPRSP